MATPLGSSARLCALAPLVLTAFCALSAACGGNPPSDPKVAPPAPATSTEEATPPPGAAPGDAPAASSAAPADAPAAAATPAATATPTTPAMDPPSSDQDECSKAAVPYEEKVRPLFNDCYQDGKKKNPNLVGAIRITIAVNTSGKVNSVHPAPSELGDSVVSCMVKAVKAHPFDGALCKGKTLTVGKTFGKP